MLGSSRASSAREAKFKTHTTSGGSSQNVSGRPARPPRPAGSRQGNDQFLDSLNAHPNPFANPFKPPPTLPSHQASRQRSFQRSNSGRGPRPAGTSRGGSARGKEVQLTEKSSLSALIGDNLKESNFLWHGEESFKSTEHQFFYEDFKNEFDVALKENKQPVSQKPSQLTADE